MQNSLTRLTGHLGIRTAAALALLATVLGVGLLTGLAGGQAQGEHYASAAADLPASPVRHDDGFADHDLFNPAATLDTSHIDDLREDPEGRCLATDGVMTPGGACVDRVQIWMEEVDIDTWELLCRLGYDHDIDDPTSLWIPMEYAIFDGPSGEHLYAVDVLRPVTPRSL